MVISVSSCIKIEERKDKKIEKKEGARCLLPSNLTRTLLFQALFNLSLFRCINRRYFLTNYRLDILLPCPNVFLSTILLFPLSSYLFHLVALYFSVYLDAARGPIQFEMLGGFGEFSWILKAFADARRTFSCSRNLIS